MEPVQPRLQSAANDNSNMDRKDEQFELTSLPEIVQGQSRDKEEPLIPLDAQTGAHANLNFGKTETVKMAQTPLLQKAAERAGDPISINLISSRADGFGGPLKSGTLGEGLTAQVKEFPTKIKSKRKNYKYLKDTNVAQWLDGEAEKIHKKLHLNKV